MLGFIHCLNCYGFQPTAVKPRGRLPSMQRGFEKMRQDGD